MWTHCNNNWSGTQIYILFILSAYNLEQICLLHCTHVLLHFYCSLHSDTTLWYIKSPKNLKQVLYTLLPNMCQKEICSPNAIYSTYENQFICTYETTMSLYIPHMNVMQSTLSPGPLLYIHWNMPWYKYPHANNKYAHQMPYICHICQFLKNTKY